MIYLRKLFTQDLRDGKQIAFPKEPSYSFLHFDYQNGEKDRAIKFVFNAKYSTFPQFNENVINTRLYCAGSESRIDGQLKAFLRDQLNASVDDIVIFKNIGTNYNEFMFYFVPASAPSYPFFRDFIESNNHVVVESEKCHISSSNLDQPYQQIFFGAPGTGKSHEIEQLTYGSMVFRTTFHPDSDYSTFVGAYKPIMREVPMTTVIGTKVVPVEDKEGNPLYESKIQYEFVPQAFAQAYVEAWQDLDTPVYLVIEEINRGNCAQIFGDIFQLLDRKNSGFSNYYIVPDEDLRQYIVKAFQDGIDERAFEIIKTGKYLCLPPNLYIWATMNTSDQSLFPIDSAFKRRWEWQYMPIEDAGKNWKIRVNNNEYDWYAFLTAINHEILALTHSEDKQLGYFFAKADAQGVIDAAKLVNKVYFYLWTDVFKDYETENNSVFKKADSNDTIAYKDFFVSGQKINEEVAEQLLKNLKLNTPEAE